MKGSRKSLKILIVSKNANHLHLQLNTLFKAVKTQYLHIGPSQDRLHSQKLVFKVKIWRGHGPLGVWGVIPPLEFDLFYVLEKYFQFKLARQLHNLLLPSGLFHVTT